MTNHKSRQLTLSSEMDTIHGAVERVVFYNAENGYTVLRLDISIMGDSKNLDEQLITAVGNIPEVSPGEFLKLTGGWTKHPRFGEQFIIEFFELSAPPNEKGIRKYLGSGLIKGIGPKLADNIVDHFGEDTLAVIEKFPERLLEVPDIGKKRSNLIASAWESQRHISDIMMFLHGHNITTNLAVKIFKEYGSRSIEVVKADPYQLAKDIYGVGFRTADKIAQDMGLPFDHPSRIETGILYALQTGINDGHVFLPRDVLLEETSTLLQIDEKLVEMRLGQLEKDKKIIHEVIVPKLNTDMGDLTPQEAIYITVYHHTEQHIANKLIELSEAKKTTIDESTFANLDTKQLSTEQISAIKNAVLHPISVITGGPGTGKTTALKTLIDLLDTLKWSYSLASPTGRAAKRLSEATGRPASTIHRLLEYSPTEGFNRNTENPLHINMLVIDESSMIDLMLLNATLNALKVGTHILFVGDIDQLPSVGAGDILNDIIESNIAKVSTLQVIFRQKEGSSIIDNAHQINQGMMPDISHQSEDMFMFPADKAEDAGDWVEEVTCRRMPSKFSLDPIKDIQVLTPIYRGAAGVNALNKRLQETLNPKTSRKFEKNLFGMLFREGDKVMQVVNDYNKDVYNGDIGFITKISLIEHTLIVDFEDHLVEYDFTEADSLIHAYAISVHKSQGSEFPAVVVPVLTQHYIMLQRNLLYTAVTRAKELCILVGNRRAIGIAVKNDKVKYRHTALQYRIKNMENQ